MPSRSRRSISPMSQRSRSMACSGVEATLPSVWGILAIGPEAAPLGVDEHELHLALPVVHGQ